MVDTSSTVNTSKVGFSLILGTMGEAVDLGLCLASLAAQTNQNFELIVVDQNHDDRLVPILASYRECFPIVHLRAEKGLSRAKNVGLERVSREIIGFPDDNCSYPPDLLERVAHFLVENPQVDGLCGRSSDMAGNNTNGRFDTKPGRIDEVNVWRRAMAYNIFLRRECSRNARFDEKLGPGAGTPWGAGDETDYLLRLLRHGASFYYDPALSAVHPAPVPPYDATAKRRAYSYGRGVGYVMHRHRSPLWLKLKWLVRPFGGVLLYAGALRWAQASYTLFTLRGRLRGMVRLDNTRGKREL